jgi:predicted amidohydrolase YtcJ
MKLGGTANLSEPFPDKPKGMHWTTYEQLREIGKEAEMASLQATVAWLDRVKTRRD